MLRQYQNGAMQCRATMIHADMRTTHAARRVEPLVPGVAVVTGVAVVPGMAVLPGVAGVPGMAVVTGTHHPSQMQCRITRRATHRQRSHRQKTRSLSSSHPSQHQQNARAHAQPSLPIDTLQWQSSPREHDDRLDLPAAAARW
eukprot:scpid65883/ scgid8542/ 